MREEKERSSSWKQEAHGGLCVVLVGALLGDPELRLDAPTELLEELRPLIG